jgi:hypothetical protein
MEANNFGDVLPISYQTRLMDSPFWVAPLGLLVLDQLFHLLPLSSWVHAQLSCPALDEVVDEVSNICQSNDHSYCNECNNSLTTSPSFHAPHSVLESGLYVLPPSW